MGISCVTIASALGQMGIPSEFKGAAYEGVVGLPMGKSRSWTPRLATCRPISGSFWIVIPHRVFEVFYTWNGRTHNSPAEETLAHNSVNENQKCDPIQTYPSKRTPIVSRKKQCYNSNSNIISQIRHNILLFWPSFTLSAVSRLRTLGFRYRWSNPVENPTEPQLQPKLLQLDQNLDTEDNWLLSPWLRYHTLAAC